MVNLSYNNNILISNIMKNLTLKGLLLIIASSFFFIQCTTDPLEGPAGQNGLDGVAGSDGTDGVDGTASCIECHTAENKEHAQMSYVLSVHAKETLHEDRTTGEIVPTSTYANRSTCTQCHTSQGYIDYMTRGTVTGSAYPDAIQTITCVTCHGTHTSFDFDNDGFDYALRQALYPVMLTQDPSYTIDLGTSNTCVNCHQPRSLPPTIEDADENGLIAVGGRFGPHHGPQSTLLEGIQGGEIDGYDYPAPQSARHRSGSTCVNCHMGESEDGLTGLHTWHPAESTCLDCHGSVPTEVTDYATNYDALRDALVANSILEDNGDGTYSLNAGNYTVAQAQAYWNYVLLMEDRSEGIHNPEYATALLTSSLDALQN